MTGRDAEDKEERGKISMCNVLLQVCDSFGRVRNTEWEENGISFFQGLGRGQCNFCLIRIIVVEHVQGRFGASSSHLPSVFCRISHLR